MNNSDELPTAVAMLCCGCGFGFGFLLAFWADGALLVALGFLGPRGLARSLAFLHSLHTVLRALVQLVIVFGQKVPGWKSHF
jgi:hypothetical protein